MKMSSMKVAKAADADSEDAYSINQLLCHFQVPRSDQQLLKYGCFNFCVYNKGSYLHNHLSNLGSSGNFSKITEKCRLGEGHPVPLSLSGFQRRLGILNTETGLSMKILKLLSSSKFNMQVVEEQISFGVVQVSA